MAPGAKAVKVTNKKRRGAGESKEMMMSIKRTKTSLAERELVMAGDAITAPRRGGQTKAVVVERRSVGRPIRRVYDV